MESCLFFRSTRVPPVRVALIMLPIRCRSVIVVCNCIAGVFNCCFSISNVVSPVILNCKLAFGSKFLLPIRLSFKFELWICCIVASKSPDSSSLENGNPVKLVFNCVSFRVKD